MRIGRGLCAVLLLLALVSSGQALVLFKGPPPVGTVGVVTIPSAGTGSGSVGASGVLQSSNGNGGLAAFGGSVTCPSDQAVIALAPTGQTICGPVGGASNTASFLTTKSETSLSNEVNLGALPAGILATTPVGGTAQVTSVFQPAGQLVGTTQVQRLTNTGVDSRRCPAQNTATQLVFNLDQCDLLTVADLQQDATIVNPTGTAVPGQYARFEICSTDSHNLSWGNQWVEDGLPLPDVTRGGGKCDYLLYQFSGATSQLTLLVNVDLFRRICPSGELLPGTYTNSNITVDAQGCLSAISSGTGSGGTATAAGGLFDVQLNGGTGFAADPGRFVYDLRNHTLFDQQTVSGLGTGAITLADARGRKGVLFPEPLSQARAWSLPDTDGKLCTVGSCGGGGSLSVREIDGSPSGTATELVFSNGALSPNGGGSFTVTTGVGGGGDFSSNTSTSVDSEVVLFSGTGGKTGKRATGTGLAKLTAGVLSTATAGTDYQVPLPAPTDDTLLIGNGTVFQSRTLPPCLDSGGNHLNYDPSINSVTCGTGSSAATPGDAAADGTTKGVATFAATDFNASSGVVSLDYTNAQAASATLKGFLTAADWTTFNGKVASGRLVNTTTPLAGGGDLSADRTLTCPTCTTNASALTANLPVIGAGGQATAVGTRSGTTTAFVTKDASTPAANDCAKWDASGNLTTAGTACGASVGDAAADGTTKGVATFTAADFNATAGVVSIDYTNAQAASGTLKGFLTAADWTTFTSKVPPGRLVSTTTPLAGGGDLSADRTLTCPTCTTNASALTANLPVIGAGGQSTAVGTRSGNTTAFVTKDASAPAANDCAKWDASGNLTTAGAACGTATSAPVDAHYLTTQAETGLTAEANLGALTTGLLKITVSTGVATPSTAVAGTDYQGVLTNSAGLAAALSDETGSAGGGLAVFNQSPTIVTPTIASFVNATHNHTSAATGGTLTDAAADGTTKGVATFTAADFNATTGVISIDYTNGQAATTSVKGFLTAADWTTFNNKVSTSVTIATTAPLAGGGDLSANRTLTCPTCTTNAAALTANQLVIGAGSQATAALGSLGTTTTVLHGNAAGAPTFGAVALGSDVSGRLPLANLVAPSTTSILLGRRTTAGDFEEISLGTNLSMTAGGVLNASAGAGGYATVQDEGTGLTTRSVINFTGAGVTCSDNAGSTRTDCTITGTGQAYSTIQEETGALTQRSTLNFVGAALTAADNAGQNRTDVTLTQSPTASTAVVGTGRTLTTSSPLGGGGDLSADRTLTCATCTTNAAGLTTNQLVLGAGGQATAALGSLGTTTTVLHGNAAGAPSFSAVSLTADVSGALPRANGGLNSTTPGTGLLRDGTTPAASELSGDATTSGSNVVTVGKVNGVTYGASPSADTVPLITAASTATYTAVPLCADTLGKHLNYDTATHTFSCGTSLPATAVLSSRSLNTSAPLSGGGDLSSDRTLSCPTCTTNAAALTANQLVLGAGSQATAPLGSLGTTTTVLHGNAAGAPTFGAVSLTADVSGSLPRANGGLNSTTPGTGLLRDGTTPAASELSGDATTSGSNAVTVAKVNGVTYPATPAVDTTPIVTASGVVTYKALPDCDDTAGQHLNYDTTTHAYSCGTSGGGAGTACTPAGSDKQAMFNNAGTTAGTSGLTLSTSQVLSRNDRVTAMSADLTISSADGPLIACTAGATTKTATLPSAATAFQGVLRLVKVDTGAGACALARAGTDTLNNAATTLSVASQNEYLEARLMSASNWEVTTKKLAVSLTADVSGRLPYANLVAPTAAVRLFGRGDTTGDWQELTLGTGLSMTGTVLSGAGVTFATASETTTGTETAKAVTPDGLAGSDFGKRYATLECVPDATAITAGTGKCYLPIHPDFNGWNIVGASAHVGNATSSGTLTVDIQRCGAVATGVRCSGTNVSVFSTSMSIDANEDGTETGNAGTINASNQALSTGQWLRVDVSGSFGSPQGLYVTMVFQKP